MAQDLGTFDARNAMQLVDFVNSGRSVHNLSLKSLLTAASAMVFFLTNITLAYGNIPPPRPLSFAAHMHRGHTEEVAHFPSPSDSNSRDGGATFDTGDVCSIQIDIHADAGVDAVIFIDGTAAYNNRFQHFPETEPLYIGAPFGEERTFQISRVIKIRHPVTRITVHVFEIPKSDYSFTVLATPARCD